MTHHDDTTDTCGRCGLPIHSAESGVEYRGDHRSHKAYRCIDLLQEKISAARQLPSREQIARAIFDRWYASKSQGWRDMTWAKSPHAAEFDTADAVLALLAERQTQ